MFQTQCFRLMRRFFLYSTILFGLLLGSGGTTYAQEMKDIFIDLPKSLLPILPKPTRERLVGQYLLHKADPKQQAPSTTNLLGSPSSIQTLTPSYIHLVLDKSTEAQYKLLYTDEGTMIVGMILTSKIAPKQSIMKFYDRTWKEIPTEDIITRPDASDFLKNPQDSTLLVFKEALVERGHMDVYADFLPDEDALIVHLSTFDDEVAQRLHPDLSPLLAPEGIKYTWNMGQFKKTK